MWILFRPLLTWRGLFRFMGVGINAPTARWHGPLAWFAGDEGEGRPIRDNSWGSAAQTGPTRNAWTAPGME